MDSAVEEAHKKRKEWKHRYTPRTTLTLRRSAMIYEIPCLHWNKVAKRKAKVKVHVKINRQQSNSSK